MSRILEWPEVRNSIKDAIAMLFDFEFQKRTGWIDSNYKHSFWDSLDYYVFDYLLDGPPDLLSQYENRIIGVTLYNKEELEVIVKFLEFYEDTFEGEMPDDYYVNHPEWPKLIEEAKAIVAMMEENNKKFNFAADVNDYWEEEEKRGPQIPSLLQNKESEPDSDGLSPETCEKKNCDSR